MSYDASGVALQRAQAGKTAVYGPIVIALWREGG